jgi:hypothetical protein
MTDAGNRPLAVFGRRFVSLASAVILGPFLPRPAMALQGGTMNGRAASHEKSLTLPAVKAAIARGEPLIAGFRSTVETTPIGGYGLQK